MVGVILMHFHKVSYKGLGVHISFCCISLHYPPHIYICRKTNPVHHYQEHLSVEFTLGNILCLCSSLFFTLYFSIQGRPEIDIIFAFWQKKKKKTCIWIWSAASPDLKYSDSHSEMRPRLKSHVDQAYHHRFMTYWAQADGGWFSLSKKKAFLISLWGFELPVSTGASVLPPKRTKGQFFTRWETSSHL